MIPFLDEISSVNITQLANDLESFSHDFPPRFFCADKEVYLELIKTAIEFFKIGPWKVPSRIKNNRLFHIINSNINKTDANGLFQMSDVKVTKLAEISLSASLDLPIGFVDKKDLLALVKAVA